MDRATLEHVAKDAPVSMAELSGEVFWRRRNLRKKIVDAFYFPPNLYHVSRYFKVWPVASRDHFCETNEVVIMKTQNSEPAEHQSLEWLKTVRQHVESLRFGVVQITVHEGRPVQIERTERVRLDKLPNS